jgi:serine/threonine-protein kinase
MSARPIGFEPELVSAATPRQLGKYLISHVLGEGAMGVVYKAMDPLIHRPVAIKAIRAPLLAPGAHDLAAANRFRTEAQAAGRLSHPNIVSVYEYGESGGERFIAMEYVDGISLLELTGRAGTVGRLPFEDALCLMLQLLDALGCAHAQGVWHRDIKPANLLITPDGRLKVTDFGIARIDSADRTHHTTVLGSPGYMAPERYTDEAPDRRVDIFSCGVLLYELLTGQAPFRGSSSAVMYQVMNHQPAPPSSLPLHPPVPAHFDAIVARALAKRAADRYADANEMREALCIAADRPIRPTISVEALLRLRRQRDEAPTQRVPRDGAALLHHGAPSPSLPRSVPSLPNWPAQLLADVEALLCQRLGPMARLVVRNAAKHCADLHGLIQHLASDVLDDEDRPAFLAEAQRRWPGLRSEAPASVPPSVLPVLGTTPLRPDLIERAQQLLAEQIGPIASLLARRAAAEAASCEQFYSRLADLAGDAVDRKKLLAELWRLG